MSLEATHIRFSLEIKDDLEVADLEKYIAGTIYPDTRYKSGINRNLTHNLSRFDSRKNLSDFEKGWMAHIIGDEIFYETIEKKFSSWFLSEEYKERFFTLGAIKIIQDLNDFLSCDIQEVIDFLDYYETHFREDERTVIEYNSIIKNMYKGKEKTVAQDCLEMWQKLGAEKGEMERLQKRLIDFHENDGLIRDVHGNFEDGVKIYKEKYLSRIKGKI